MEQERARQLKLKNLVYERMFNQVKLCAQEFTEYKSLAETEASIKETIIEKQQMMLNQMFTELRAVKTMLEIPRFRDQLPKYDFKGMDFKQFRKIFGQIYEDISVAYLDDNKKTN